MADQLGLDAERLEKQVTDVSNALAHLSDPDGWKNLIIARVAATDQSPASFTAVHGESPAKGGQIHQAYAANILSIEGASSCS